MTDLSLEKRIAALEAAMPAAKIDQTALAAGILAQVAEDTGISRDMLCGRSGMAALTDAREVFAKRAHEAGCSAAVIGAAMCRGRQYASHLINGRKKKEPKL
jgi:hypothetical protein